MAWLASPNLVVSPTNTQTLLKPTRPLSRTVTVAAALLSGIAAPRADKSNRLCGCFVVKDEGRYLRSEPAPSTGFRALLAVLLVVSLGSRAAAELAPCVGGYLVGREYVAGPGDTLRTLASCYGLALSVLTSANQLKLHSVLRPGEILQIDNRHLVPQTLTNGILIDYSSTPTFRVRRRPLDQLVPGGSGTVGLANTHRRFHDCGDAARPAVDRASVDPASSIPIAVGMLQRRVGLASNHWVKRMDFHHEANAQLSEACRRSTFYGYE
jgi:LysM domain